MKNTFCDICKESAEDIDYTLPMWADVRGGYGNPILVPKVCLNVAKNINLCSKCSTKIANFIYGIY